MKNKRAILIIAVCVLILVLGNGLYKVPGQEEAMGSSSDKVSGYAWSDNIGWISFNCTDVSCTSSDYGVDVDLGSGDFSGYAWSDNIGWIDFSPNPPYPSAPNYSANYDSSTGEVNGWIRALSYGDSWDGWILLGDEVNSWTNQVSINPDTKEFEGWAWGSSVIGWISFNCSGPGTCQ
ncbi:MAG: hypothetical protein GF387_01590 [Candidatus Portnoybacteria bacterium]|nr:hypothetical protein [Candidatus Portnoybacteria bacterium]